MAIKIIVETEEEKEALLSESEYIHYFAYLVRGRKGRPLRLIGLDSDKAGMLMHLYLAPENIEVKSNSK